jgi:hypothetical protein
MFKPKLHERNIRARNSIHIKALVRLLVLASLLDDLAKFIKRVDQFQKVNLRAMARYQKVVDGKEEAEEAIARQYSFSS